ncbi:U3 small nucleolar ribonucleoprotein IMP3 [Pelomyxa schiedti]|nr:U3 small nucleolar ribonucleoprotein IMP3 [Pelomyxa schiedti]
MASRHTSLRPLKFHEKKLLKKVDFINWASEPGKFYEYAAIRKYHLQREDYHKYKKIIRQIQEFFNFLDKQLPHSDPDAIEKGKVIIKKLHEMAIVPNPEGTQQVFHIGPTDFCRRRLSVVLVRLRMAPDIGTAVKYISHNHVRIGPEVVTDPAMLVTKKMEDYITWTDQSRIKETILKFRNELDDFDLLS